MNANLDYSYCEHLQYKMCAGHVVRGFNLADGKATLKGRTTL